MWLPVWNWSKEAYCICKTLLRWGLRGAFQIPPNASGKTLRSLHGTESKSGISSQINNQLWLDLWFIHNTFYSGTHRNPSTALFLLCQSRIWEEPSDEKGGVRSDMKSKGTGWLCCIVLFRNAHMNQRPWVLGLAVSLGSTASQTEDPEEDQWILLASIACGWGTTVGWENH